MAQAEIGIFGGSGFYDFLEDLHEVEIDTECGAPSSPVALGRVAGRDIAFIARHGRKHSIPAHRINYRANISAFAQLGVRRILAPFSCGSLQPGIHPGEFLAPDQFVDRTSGREDSYFHGPVVHHIGAARPYCEETRRLVVQAGDSMGITMHDGGTVVVIQGPRFSTTSESRWFTHAGWQVVNMTQYPEVILARELGICYAGIALVTDYDAGLHDEQGEVNIEQVFQVFRENIDRVRDLILATIPSIPSNPSCDCRLQAEMARLG